MKKILALLMMLLPAFAIASNKETKEDAGLTFSEVPKVNSYNIFARVSVNLSDIHLPFTITVPAPNEKVIGISGPVQPSIKNWKVQDGYLTITYTRPTEIMELYDGGTFLIEVTTSPLMYYAIELTVN